MTPPPLPRLCSTLTFLGLLWPCSPPTRPGDLRPAPPCPPALLRASGFSAAALPPPTPESDTKESGSWAPGWVRVTCQVFGLLLPKRTVVARRAAAGKGKFSTNLFFFRLRSFDSPAPQRNPHLLSLRHQLVPHPLLCCWQSHAVTSHPPPRGTLRGPRVVRGHHLCAGHRLPGSATVPPGSRTSRVQ